jgi:hypothetical protein
VKLGQNGIVSFSINLAAFQASSAARMKHSNDGTRIRVTINDYGHKTHEKT